MTRPNLQLPVSIGTERFVVDLTGLRYQTIAAMREMVDQGAEAGDQSFTNVGIFKRTQQDFLAGAGQVWFDLIEESDRKRFRTSQGIDPWDRRSLKLLHDTALYDPEIHSLQVATGAPDLIGTTASGEPFLYVLATGLSYSSSGYDSAQVDLVDGTSTASLALGLSTSGPVLSFATDGSRLWAANGADGLVQFNLVTHDFTPEDANAAFSPTMLGYANGRLIGAIDGELFEVAGSGGLPTSSLYTHPNPNHQWHAIASAPNAIYVAGGTEDLCEIYKIGVDEAGALTTPTHAMTLPAGEITHTMVHYGGLMVMGTSRGIRLAAIDASGFLTFGPVIEIEGGVHHLLGRGEFIWFSWMDFDTDTSGLGRLNLSRFTADLVPAYAPDLMATVGGEISSIAYVDGRLWFVTEDVDGAVGLWRESDDYVHSGTFRSGRVDFGTPERKRFTSLEVAAEDLPGAASVTYGVTDQSGTDQTVGIATTSPASGPITDIEGDWVEVWLTLARGAVDETPDVSRWTLRALPLPKRTAEIYLPVILNGKVDPGTGASPGVTQDALAKWLYLLGLVESREVVEVGFGAVTFTGFVDQLYLAGQDDATPIKGWTDKRDFLEATWVAKVVTVEGTTAQ